MHAIARYRALDPAAWLKHDETPEVELGKKAILLRLEESKASYIADKKLGTVKMIDDFVSELWESANIVTLCRYQDQRAEVEARYGSRVQILKDVVDGTALLKSIQLFVGVGGTMTQKRLFWARPRYR